MNVDQLVTLGVFACFCAIIFIISLKYSRQRPREDPPVRGSRVSLGSDDSTGEVTKQTEEIIGWRAWRVDTLNSELWLKSVVVPVYWQPGEALQACYFPPPAGSVHGPGIYAAKTEAGALEAMDDWTGTVYGTVALWGTVVEHVRGYRAQYAYPKHLWCEDEETARALNRRYGCETEVSERLRSIRA